MFSKIKMKKIVEELFNYDAIPSTKNLNPEIVRLVAVQAFVEEYSTGNNGIVINSCLVLKMQHDSVHKPFFVHIFSGCQKNDPESNIVQIFFEEKFSTNKTLLEDNGRFLECRSGEEVKILTAIEDDFINHWINGDEAILQEDGVALNNLCDSISELQVQEKLIIMAKQHVAEKFISSPTKRVDFDSYIEGTVDETNSDVYVLDPWTNFNSGDFKSQMQLDVKELVQLLNKAREM